jgi:NitT/TauT family transport system ATP-binding protein
MISEAILLSDRVVVFSHRPGRVRSEFAVPLARPRNLDIKSDHRFVELENKVWKQIEEEVKSATGFAAL